MHCESNNNPPVRQFVDALKSAIVNGPAYRSVLHPNCEDDGATLLYIVQVKRSTAESLYGHV